MFTGAQDFTTGPFVCTGVAGSLVILVVGVVEGTGVVVTTVVVGRVVVVVEVVVVVISISQFLPM